MMPPETKQAVYVDNLPSEPISWPRLRYWLYVPVKLKALTVLLIATCWMVASIYFSQHWFKDLSDVVGIWLSAYLILFIAIIPGFMNAFIAAGLMMDQRPSRKKIQALPAVTVLVAAYNEEKTIEETLHSLNTQDYSGFLKIIVIDDGSKDQTSRVVASLEGQIDNLALITLPQNQGKSGALNVGLTHTTTDLVITVDSDCFVKTNGIRNLVQRYLSDPTNTAAVAGTVLIRNSRKNILTKAQEWDYFLGISAAKRIQSFFQGTLVAQGAFSLYRKDVLLKLGGWPKTVGEDIVLTWNILNANYRVGHAEDAYVFTQCPETFKQFIRQRQRWSRGLIEAFKANPGILFKWRLSSIYVWWNALYPFLDVAYTIGFIPGVIAAFFGCYWIAGPMTLVLLPSAVLVNYAVFRVSAKSFKAENLRVRSNLSGLLFYVFAYSMVLQPACVYGYLSELLMLKKKWGTK